MTPWSWIAKHRDGAQRLEQWQRVLGSNFAAWEVFLTPVEDPVGIRFWADFGSGESEHEMIQGIDGLLACSVDAGAAVALNPTQAEFRRLHLRELLEAIQREAKLVGPVSALPGTAGGHRIGTRQLGGKRLAVFLVPRPQDLFGEIIKEHFAPEASQVDVSLLLIPSASDLTPAQHRDLVSSVA